MCYVRIYTGFFALLFLKGGKKAISVTFAR